MTRAAPAGSHHTIYHLNTARLCQGHTSHEHGAARFAHVSTWPRKFLFRESSTMGLALQNGELLRSGLSNYRCPQSYLQVEYLCLHLPHLTPMRAASFLRREAPFRRTKIFCTHPHRNTLTGDPRAASYRYFLPGLGVVRDLKSQPAIPTGSFPGDKSRNEDNACQKKIGCGPLSTPRGRA